MNRVLYADGMTRQGAFAVGILFFAVVLVPAGHGRTDSEPAAAVRQAPIVAVTVSASTWRNRGRVSFPVEATIRRKLTSAGLAIAANPAEPADLVMKVA